MSKQITSIENKAIELRLEFNKVKEEYLKQMDALYQELLPMLQEGARCAGAYNQVVPELVKYDYFKRVDSLGNIL